MQTWAARLGPALLSCTGEKETTIMLKYYFWKIVLEWQDEKKQQKLEWRKEHMQ